MISIKREFESVVYENTAWLYAFVKSKLSNKDIAQDLLQEIWIKAYRAYDNYYDDGRIKAWLYRIAQNHLNNYFNANNRVQFVSLDASFGDDDSLYTYLSSSVTPEDEYIQKELISEVLAVVSRLSYQHKQVITYRFIEGLTIDETARLMNIPKGTVKSKTHYALGQIRKELNYTKETEKGAVIMACKEIYKYLFVYAKGLLSSEVKETVEKHLEECETCRNVVTALKILIPTMTFALDDEQSHFIINFPVLGVSLLGSSLEIADYKERNAELREWNGIIPEDRIVFNCGFGKGSELVGMFDNEGNEIEFIKYRESDEHYRVKATRVNRFYKNMWLYMVTSENANSFNTIAKSKEAPNLRYGRMNNQFGAPVKSALYQAIPASAENIRIKRGNGVIDGGTYKFAYVDRYIAEDESITLDYSYLLNQ